MLSLRARVIIFLFKNRDLLRFKFKKEKIDWTTYEAILRFRQEADQTSKALGKLPPGITVSPVSISDMPAEWILPPQGKSDNVILYFHGGGYISGSCQGHRAIVAKFVKNSGIGALLFEYRLAPEHPYPAALEDAVAAYNWLLAQGIKASNISFIGDSAGGGLALATLLALKDQGITLPAAAAVLSPVTDYTCSGDSYRRNAKVCLAPEGTGPAFSKHYAQDQDPAQPYISPLNGDLHQLPPLLIYVGSNETLLDDSTRFAEKAKNSGVDVTLRIGEGLFHCYPACAPLFPEATKAMDEICTFVKIHSGK